jgi:hypothetical protein
MLFKDGKRRAMRDLVCIFLYFLAFGRIGIRWDGKTRDGEDSRKMFANMVLELRIHEHTERGDNDTVKMPNGQTVVIDGKKCSDK